MEYRLCLMMIFKEDFFKKNGKKNIYKMLKFDNSNYNESIENIIDGFISNGRLLIKIVFDVAKKAIENDKKTNGDLISEDERISSERDYNNFLKDLKEKGIKYSKRELESVWENEKDNYYTHRFEDILPQIESYLRLSYLVDLDGWTEEKALLQKDGTYIEEPKKEKLLRSLYNKEDTIKYRHVAMAKFITYSYKFWDAIYDKNQIFLIEHFSSLFPDSQFTDKINIIFGNDLNGHTKYIDAKKLNNVWKLIHGLIKLSIKYICKIGKTEFHIKKETNGVKEIIETVVVDLDYCLNKWDVNPEEECLKK